MLLNGNNRTFYLDPEARKATLVRSHSTASATSSLLLNKSPQSAEAGENRTRIYHIVSDKILYPAAPQQNEKTGFITATKGELFSGGRTSPLPPPIHSLLQTLNGTSEKWAFSGHPQTHRGANPDPDYIKLGHCPHNTPTD